MHLFQGMGADRSVEGDPVVRPRLAEAVEDATAKPARRGGEGRRGSPRSDAGGRPLAGADRVPAEGPRGTSVAARLPRTAYGRPEVHDRVGPAGGIDRHGACV